MVRERADCLFSLNHVLDGVIQLIHTYTNKPIIKQIPRIFTDCPVQITRKENGLYTFSNAQNEIFSVKVELPQFLPEHFVMKKEKSIMLKPVRCCPDPKCIIGDPDENITYFTGTYKAGEELYFMCPVKYCKIRISDISKDNRMIFESRNFTNAGTGRWIGIESKNGKITLLQTDIDVKYNPLKYFTTKKAVIKPDKIKNIFPVFYSRADNEGKFIIAAEYAESGKCSLMQQDGTVIRSINYDNSVSDNWVAL